MEYEALALTDHGNLYGAIEFYKKAKAFGIKPIIGVELYLARRKRFDRTPKIDSKSYHLTVLAENEKGYQNLLKLISKAYLEGFYYKPRVDKDLLKEFREGLIVLSGCPNGEIPRLILEGNYNEAKKKVYEYLEIFGKDNFFLEVNYHPNLEEARKLKKALIDLSRETNIPLVATYDVHYVYPEDREVHDIFLAIQQGKDIEESDRLSMKEDDFSLASEERIWELYQDIPESIEITWEIAQRINLEIELGKFKFPKYPLPENLTEFELLKKLTFEGLEKRGLINDSKAKDRANYELSIIEKTGFAGYFLIVQDIVKWAKKNGIMVGVGRGSAAGSLVSYLLEITEINPLKYDLLFERFLNPERIEMPDIDIDICDYKRDLVFDYLKERYGQESFAQIATFGKMASRAAVRDIGRALGFSFSFVDKLARLIPAKLSLEEAEKLNDVQKVLKEDKNYKLILDYAKRVENVVRHVSVHPSGVIITPGPIIEYTPLQFAPQDQSRVITQYDMNATGELGLLKMDFLGLRNLSIIEDTLRLIEERHKEKINLNDLNPDKFDEDTYKIYAEGKTVGVFQVEGKGMTNALKMIKPKNVEELAAVIALYRPGPVKLIPNYVKRKYNQEPIEYLHPKLEPILSVTYGILIYQEQLMRIATDLAGFTQGEADTLRKAIAKKKVDLLQSLKEKLIQGMIKNGIEPNLAQKIWEWIEPFGQYGFNKSHAVSYAFISFYTAYLKGKYPLEFINACLLHEGRDVERIYVYLEEAKNYGFKILPPDINESDVNFRITDLNTIRFGLGNIKNVGLNLIEAILEERKKNGPFKSLVDFLKRVKHKDLNKKSLESLIKAGVFDRFHSRNILIANLEVVLDYSLKVKEFQVTKSLFGSKSEELIFFRNIDIPKLEIYRYEKELLGIYLSGHPFEDFDKLLKGRIKKIKEALEMEEGLKIALAGILNSLERKLTRDKKPFAYLEIEDLTGKIEVFLPPEIYEQYFEILKEGRIYYLVGTIRKKEKNYLMADLLTDITDLNNNLKLKERLIQIR